MINQSESKTPTLWLDPASSFSDEVQAHLNSFELEPIPVITIEDLKKALSVSRIAVLHLIGDTSLLVEVMEFMKASNHAIPVICRVDRNNFEIGIQAIKAGATHVIPSDEWSEKVWKDFFRLGENKSDKKQESFVFVDPMSQKLLALSQKVAQAEVSTLIVGPSGSGKEVLAKVIHESSPRKKEPFIALNCAAMPEHLIEDILFGHDKGAFTGAAKDHKGLFEQAEGGSIFLDEIGDMPYSVQTKLLRVLQERKLTRLGSQKQIDLNVRLIAATNKDLKEAILQKEFREDLYFRISAFKLRIPSLKERPKDIIPLSENFLKVNGKKGNNYILSSNAQTKLISYDWHGNVRELSNVIQRALVLCQGTRITDEHLIFDDIFDSIDDEKSTFASNEVESFATNDISINKFEKKNKNLEDLGSVVKLSEQKAIMSTIKSSSNRVEAAKKLGISPRTLRYKLAKYKENGIALATME